jgi:hypothetical protein
MDPFCNHMIIDVNKTQKLLDKTEQIYHEYFYIDLNDKYLMTKKEKKEMDIKNNTFKEDKFYKLDLKLPSEFELMNDESKPNLNQIKRISCIGWNKDVLCSTSNYEKGNEFNIGTLFIGFFLNF